MQIFDMDGTLIDSNGIWKDVDTAFLAKRGLPYTKEYYEGVAHTIFPLAARFTKEFCHLPESEEAIMAEWMDMAGDLYGTSVPVKPGVREYLIPSHLGKEPAAVKLADALQLSPVIHAGMALGEGTGAVMMFTLLDMAMSIYGQSATFSEIKVEQYRR